MALDIVDNGCTGLDGADVGSAELFALQQGVDTPTDGAGQRIVENNVNLSQPRGGVDVSPPRRLTTQDALEVLHSDAGVGIGVVDDNGQSIVGDGYSAGQILAIDKALALLLRQVATGKGQPRLQLHELLDGILFVGVLHFERVKGVLVAENVEFLIEDRTETFVCHEIAGSALVVLFGLSIFRLVPTSEEQA